MRKMMRYLLLSTFKIIKVVSVCSAGPGRIFEYHTHTQRDVLRVVMVTGLPCLYSRQGLTHDRADGARFLSVEQRCCSALGQEEVCWLMGDVAPQHCVQ